MNLTEPIKTELFKNIDSFINEIDLCFDYKNISKILTCINSIKKNETLFNVFVNKTYLHLYKYEKEMSVILFSNNKIRTPAYNFLDNIILFEDSTEPLKLITFTNENKNTKKSFLKYIYNIYMSCFFLYLHQNKNDTTNNTLMTELNDFVSNITKESLNTHDFPDPPIEEIIIPNTSNYTTSNRIPNTSNYDTSGLNGLMSSLMGNIDIMNIANEISSEMKNETLNPMDIMSSLMSGNINDGPLGNLMNKIKTSVDSKINSGEINQTLLEEQARDIINKVQDTGMANIPAISNILQQSKK